MSGAFEWLFVILMAALTVNTIFLSINSYRLMKEGKRIMEARKRDE